MTDVNPTSQDTYSRTSGTNRIASVTTPAGTRSFTHDARGNLSAEDRPGTNDVTVGYDGFARLTSYVRTGEASLAMAYNGMDQRVALVSGGVTRRFVYDMDGRLLGEYGPNGSQFFAEYIWMLPEAGDAGIFGGDDGTGGWTPLAVAASNGAGASQTFHWLHTSHLGVPVGSYNASGTATTLTGITLLGFPGQTQTLTDLYYNQYRDYDPTTGRYLQADPIGLAGDVNPYVYALANPINFTDPTGEIVPVIVAAGGGALLGAGVELGIQALGNYLQGRCVFDSGNYEWGEVALGGALGATGGWWYKGMLRLTTGSMRFSNASRRIRRNNGLIGQPVDLHHWLMPRRYENLFNGRAAAIVNRPWNLRTLPRAQHQRLHSGPYPAVLRPLLGAPRPVQIGAGIGSGGTAIDAANGNLDD